MHQPAGILTIGDAAAPVQIQKRCQASFRVEETCPLFPFFFFFSLDLYASNDLVMVERKRKLWLLGTLLCLLTVVTYLELFLYIRREIARDRAELHQNAVQTESTLENLINDIDRVSGELKYVPANQAELESAMGKTLPEVFVLRTLVPVEYRRKDKNSYYLVYLSDRGYQRFDSDLRESGWTSSD